MKSIKTLYEHLFNQLDRLSSATGEELNEEIDKSRAMVEVSQQILIAAQTEADIIVAVKNLGTGFIVEHEQANGLLENGQETKLFDDSIESEEVNADDLVEPTDTDLLLQRAAWREGNGVEEDANGKYLTEEKMAQINKLKKKNQNRI